MALAAVAERVDGDVVPDAGDDVLQDAPAGLVEEHVVGHHRRHPQPCGEVRELVQPELVVRPPPQCERQVGAVAEGLAQAAQAQPAVRVGEVRHEDRDQALAIGDEVGPFEMAACPCRRAACRATAAGRAASRPGGRWDRRAPRCRRRGRAGIRRRAGRRWPWPPHARARCRPASSDRDGERFDPKRGRALEELVGRGRPAQEGEMRRHLQLGIAWSAHPNTPCRNQRCEPVSASSPSPAR